MARTNKSNKNNKLTLKSGIFWGTILLVTLAFFVVVVFKWVDSSKVVTSYDRMETLVGEEIFQQFDKTKTGTYEYYVFVYGSSKDEEYTTDVNQLEEHVCNYLTFVNRNSDAVKLYGFDIDDAQNEEKVSSSSNLSNTNYQLWKVSKNDVPCLLKITVIVTMGENGENKSNLEIDYVFNNVQSIKTELNNTIIDYNKTEE